MNPIQEYLIQLIMELYRCDREKAKEILERKNNFSLEKQ